MADRLRSSKLKAKASKWEDADFTAGHASYRRHLENVRRLITSVEYTIARDTQEMARWMRRHSKPSNTLVPSRCWRLSWLDTWGMSLRYRLKGKLVADLVDEAAQAAVLMAQIHQQYLAMERGDIPNEERYRRRKET